MEYTVDGEEYQKTVDVTRRVLNITEGALTLNLNGMPKNLLEATDLTITSINMAKDVHGIYDDAFSTDDNELIGPPMPPETGAPEFIGPPPESPSQQNGTNPKRTSPKKLDPVEF